MYWLGLAIGFSSGVLIGGGIIAILANNKFSNWAINYAEKLKKEYEEKHIEKSETE